MDPPIDASWACLFARDRLHVCSTDDRTRFWTDTAARTRMTAANAPRHENRPFTQDMEKAFLFRITLQKHAGQASSANSDESLLAGLVFGRARTR